MLAEAIRGADVNLIIARLLHDKVEDTKTRYKEITEKLGDDIVDALTINLESAFATISAT